MFSFKKKEQESYAKDSEVKLTQSEIKKILRTVSIDDAFYFYEGIGKSTGHVARSLVDFREKINTVPSTSLIFHLRRKDFGKWIREIIGDSKLAERINDINPGTFDFKIELYTTVSKRIKKLNEMPPATTVISEDVQVTQHFSETKLPR